MSESTIEIRSIEDRKIEEFNEKNVRKLIKNLEEFMNKKNKSFERIDDQDLTDESNPEMLKQKIVKLEIYIHQLEGKLDAAQKRCSQPDPELKYYPLEKFKEKLVNVKQNLEEDAVFSDLHKSPDRIFNGISERLERIMEQSKVETSPNNIFDYFIYFVRPKHVKNSSSIFQQEKLFELQPDLDGIGEMNRQMNYSFIGNLKRWEDDIDVRLSLKDCLDHIDEELNKSCMSAFENRFFVICFDKGQSQRIIDNLHMGLVFTYNEFEVQLANNNITFDSVEARWTLFTSKRQIEIFKQFILNMQRKKLKQTRFKLTEKNNKYEHFIKENTEKKGNTNQTSQDREYYKNQMKPNLDQLFYNKLTVNNIFKLDDGYKQCLNNFESTIQQKCMSYAMQQLTFEEIVLLMQLLMLGTSKVFIIGPQPNVNSSIALLLYQLLERFNINNFLSIHTISKDKSQANSLMNKDLSGVFVDNWEAEGDPKAPDKFFLEQLLGSSFMKQFSVGFHQLNLFEERMADYKSNFQVYKQSQVKFKKEGDKLVGDAKMVWNDKSNFSRIYSCPKDKDKKDCPEVQDSIQMLEIWKKISSQQSIHLQKFEDVKIEKFIWFELNEYIAKQAKVKDDKEVRNQVKNNKDKLAKADKVDKSKIELWDQKTMEAILKQFHQYDHEFVMAFVTSSRFINQVLEDLDNNN